MIDCDTAVNPTLINELNFTYLAAGSIETVTRHPNGPTNKVQYSHDAHNRLTQDWLLDPSDVCNDPNPY